MAGSLYTAIRFELRHSREYAFSIFQAPILDVADLVCCQAMHTKPKIPSAQSTRSSQPPRDFVLIGMGFGIQVNTIITMLLMLLACHPPTSKHQGFRVSCSRGLQIRVGCAGTPAAWALPPRLRHLHIEDKPTFEGHTNAPPISSQYTALASPYRTGFSVPCLFIFLLARFVQSVCIPRETKICFVLLLRSWRSVPDAM